MKVLTGAASIASGTHVIPAMPRPHPAMAAGKAAFVLDDRPDLFVVQLVAESDHGGPRRTILDHPEDLPFRTMAPKSMLVKILRGRIQRCGDRTIACTALSMTCLLYTSPSPRAS